MRSLRIIRSSSSFLSWRRARARRVGAFEAFPFPIGRHLFFGYLLIANEVMLCNLTETSGTISEKTMCPASAWNYCARWEEQVYEVALHVVSMYIYDEDRDAD